jgi:hypothetical protein
MAKATAPNPTQALLIGQFCVVRCRDSGVQTGYLEALDGSTAVLREQRRIWRWKGANTVLELSLRGADQDYTRITEPVALGVVTDAIEIIPCTDAARDNLSKSRWDK